jgi:drug/metabolite transporter (DMT)-like permease
MTGASIAALVGSQLGLVIGQVFLKKGMAEPAPASAVETTSRKRFKPWMFLPIGIFFLTIWFLLWLGLMSRMDLSQQMPLEAISPIFIMAAGVIFLKEKCGIQGWLGLILTGLGVYLVAVS